MALMSMLIGPIAKLFTKGLDVLDKFVEDKDLRNELKAALEIRFMELATTELTTIIESQRDVILGEVKGENWLQRNWRPVLMLTIILIIFNNFVAAPYIMLFFPGKALMLELPGWMGALLTTGVGGYIASRGIEKIKGAAGSILPKIR